MLQYHTHLWYVQNTNLPYSELIAEINGCTIETWVRN